MTEVSAVPTCRRRAASGTGAYFRSHRGDHPTIAVSLNSKNPHVRPGSPIHVLSHARLSARRPIKPTSTESEADPLPRLVVMAWRGSRARGAFRAPAFIAFSRERHRLRSPVVAPVRQALVRMLTWPIISAGKSKRPTFTAKAIANYGRDCALPGFARALAACAG